MLDIKCISFFTHRLVSLSSAERPRMEQLDEVCSCVAVLSAYYSALTQRARLFPVPAVNPSTHVHAHYLYLG